MILLLLFVVVPIAELYTIIKVGGAIGVLNTFGLIILVAVVGAWLMKREGMRVWRRFGETLAAGKVPTKEIIDGVLVLAAGALMLTPGFLTDVFGILMIFPPTRVMFRSYILRRSKSGSFSFVSRITRDGHTTMHYGGSQSGGDFIDTDATEPRGEL